MKTIKFTKMQGCGNDFVIIDYDEYQKTSMQPSELALKVCERHFGIGADGMIIPILHSKKADFWQITTRYSGRKKIFYLNIVETLDKYNKALYNGSVPLPGGTLVFSLSGKRELNYEF